MNNMTTRKVLMGFCTVLTVLILVTLTAAAQTTSTSTVGSSTGVVTRQLSGTVAYVEGNTLVVKMASGEIRNFNIPDNTQFVIDGVTKTVGELQPGTVLNATVTTTTTSATERTIQTASGKVWYVGGTTVILTMANGQNKQFNVKGDYKFMVDGRPATVFDLRKGMMVTGEKITETPVSTIARNTKITGHAPVAKAAPVEAAAPAPVRKAAPAAEPVAAPAPLVAKKAPAPAPAAAPVAPVASATPAKLPKTGSPLPLAGVLGMLFTGAGLALRKMRRS
jgi:LPXTG-motif cell wall-anchored protein